MEAEFEGAPGIVAAQHSPEEFDRKKTGLRRFRPWMHPGSRVLRNTRYTERFFKQTVTNATAAPSSTVAASVAFKPDKDDQPMTIRTRVALGISAAAVSLSLALAPAAFAQDEMGRDDGMKTGDPMSRDTLEKDS